MTRVFFSVGDTSGDIHTARLIGALRERIPDLQVEGLGGERMLAAGCPLVEDLMKHAILGIGDSVKAVPFMTGVLRRVAGALDARRPDAVVLVDYPVFNLSVARTAHRRGIPVYYFVAPQLWAWANWRVGRYARVVDEALVIFPFEVPFYEAAGLRTSYIGHPSLDGLPVELPLLEEITSRPCPVAVLPGSRRRELDKHLPIFMQAARRLKAAHADVSFHTAHINDPDREQTLAEAARAGVEVVCHGRQVHEVMASCRCAMISSGTATMETAMLGTPMVIFYSITPFEQFLRHTVSVTDYVGQVNLAAGKEVCPEILQTDAESDRLYEALEPLLGDTPEFRRQTEEIAAIRARISPGAVDRAADILADRLAKTSNPPVRS